MVSVLGMVGWPSLLWIVDSDTVLANAVKPINCCVGRTGHHSSCRHISTCKFCFFSFLLFVDEVNQSIFPEMALQFSAAYLRTLKGSFRLTLINGVNNLRFYADLVTFTGRGKKNRNYHYSSSNNIPVVSTDTRVPDTTQLDKRQAYQLWKFKIAAS